MFFDFADQRAADTLPGGIRRDEQRADEAGIHHADKTLQHAVLLPYPGLRGGQVNVAHYRQAVMPVAFGDKRMRVDRTLKPQLEQRAGFVSVPVTNHPGLLSDRNSR